MVLQNPGGPHPVRCKVETAQPSCSLHCRFQIFVVGPHGRMGFASVSHWLCLSSRAAPDPQSCGDLDWQGAGCRWGFGTHEQLVLVGITCAVCVEALDKKG